MRSFELSTRMKAVQRSRGDSATAKAAYRACCVIECEREGRTHDYSRKGGLEASEIVLPDKAPAWAKDRGKLWNAAEIRERNKDKRAKEKFKSNAQTARDVMFTYPAELSKEGRLNVARIVARHLVSTSAVAVDFNIHEPGKEGDERNYHCHVMFTTRRMTGKGLGEKCREWEATHRREQHERHVKERAALKLRQDFDLQRKLAELDSRERRGREAIERDLAAARKADTSATGFRRVFEIVTGQNMREAFARQNREAERVQEAEQKRGDLKAEIQAERNAYVRGQTDERQRLAERHKGEDMQMDRAVEHRRSMDRTAEVRARRIEANVNTLQHQQSRGRSIGRDITGP